MRELKMDELEVVSGGFGFENEDEEKRMDTVIVTATAYRYSSIGGIGRIGGGLSGLLGQLAGFAGPQVGGGAGGEYGGDPSPEDGVKGLEVTENPDGTYTYTAEHDGFFDFNGDGAQNNGEPYMYKGFTETTKQGESRGTALGALSTFSPLPLSAYTS